MSSEHKKPLYAFVIVMVVCALFMGYTIRAEAVRMLVRGAGVPSAALLHLPDLGGVLQPSQSPAGASGETIDAPQRATGETNEVRKAEPTTSPTARPKARPAYTASRAVATKVAARTTSAKHRSAISPGKQSKKARKPSRKARNAAPARQVPDLRPAWKHKRHPVRSSARDLRRDLTKNLRRTLRELRKTLRHLDGRRITDRHFTGRHPRLDSSRWDRHSRGRGFHHHRSEQRERSRHHGHRSHHRGRSHRH